MENPFSDVGDEWTRPRKVANLLAQLGMEVPDRLRRERLLLLMTRLKERGIEAVLANYAPVDSVPPSIELKLRLRLKPELLFTKYQVLQRFAAGFMSEGFKVRAPDGSILFLKRVRVSGQLADALRRELGVYAKLQRAHVDHVLAFLTFERDEEHIALLTEFAEGGTLTEHVAMNGGRLEPPHAKKIVAQILAGIRELHTFDIIHRDLKPGNVLRVGEKWKLGDFGISKDLERLVTQGKTFKQYGSEGFAPPEQWDWSEAHPSADVHAFGSLLAYLLTGKTWPTNALAAEAPVAVEKLGGKDWGQLVRRCTARSPEDRPSLDEVDRALGRL